MIKLKKTKVSRKRKALAVGAAGALAGAALSVAAAKVLSKKENRKKIGKALNTLRQRAVKGLEEMSQNAQDLKEKAGKKFAGGGRKVVKK